MSSSFSVRLLTALIVACGLAGLGGCSGDPRFVRPVPMPISQDQVGADPDSRYADGYLRIFVSSNLDETGRLLDFGKQGERPAMLLISARFGKGTVASFSADAEPEIPVLLYDVQSGRTLSSVVDNALLTSGLLIDPQSLSTSPHLQIFVRGVPQDKARWVTDLLELATAEPVLAVGLSFVPGGPALSPLSTKLGSLLSEEIKSTNKPWEEKTLLGLRPDQGVASLHGRQFVVLLNSTTIDLEVPPELKRCPVRGASIGLCQLDGTPWEPDQAYVRFELDVSDYRSIRDFLSAETSCEATERVWSDFRALVGSGQLARRQAEYERHILARGDLLMSVRRSQTEFAGSAYANRLLLHAQQFSLLASPDDAYWKAHFSNSAKQLDACIRTAAAGGRSSAAEIWDKATELYAKRTTYPAWADALAATSDPESPALLAAERELLALQRLLAMDDLQNLDRQTQSSLTGLSLQLERMLVEVYQRSATRLEQVPDGGPAGVAQLQGLAARTACKACELLLLERAALLEAALAEPEPPATQLAPAAPVPAQTAEQGPEPASELARDTENGSNPQPGEVLVSP